MRHTWLATVARSAGLTVVEHTGWASRGGTTGKPEVVVAHHTGTPLSIPSDLPTLGILLDGRPDLPGPLCHYALSRAGVVHVIAAGKANHAGKGRWAGTDLSINTVGIEAEHPGGKAHWPDVQLDAYDRLCAAILRHIGQPASHLAGHKEWALPAGRKVDPNLDMNAMRRRVERLMQPTEGSDVELYRQEHSNTVWEVVGSLRFFVSGAAFAARGLAHSTVRVLPESHPIWTLPEAKVASK